VAFTEDLSPFFDVAGHAVAAVFHLGGAPAVNLNAKVIFDNPTEEVTLYETAIEARAPTLLAKTAEIPGVVRGKTVTVNSITYTIVKVTAIDDGAVSQVHLQT
jgi:hypothetical protein